MAVGIISKASGASFADGARLVFGISALAYLNVQMRSEKMISMTFFRVLLVVVLMQHVLACANAEDYRLRDPDHDAFVGKTFEDSIYMGRRVYKVISSNEISEELENRRSDGCILVFGVRKHDDMILYWRVDSGQGSCKVRNKPINR